MRPCLVEVHHIRIEHALELLLMQNQQMIQAFLSDAPQEPLADRIGSRGMIRRFEYLDATCPRHPSKARPKLTVVITYQIRGGLPIRGGFSQVLGHPEIGRRSRDPDMDHPSRLQFYDEERKERPKEEISDLQEVARPDLCGVVARKGCPLLPSWRLCANSSHVLLDGALADPNAQFQEFSPNPFGTPKPIVLRHLPDQ